jgi:hypothetical protein
MSVRTNGWVSRATKRYRARRRSFPETLIEHGPHDIVHTAERDGNLYLKNRRVVRSRPRCVRSASKRTVGKAAERFGRRSLECLD